MYLPIFIFLAGLIIGLGAVTVIDIHGFLGQKSHYWTLATTRAHKITKPLIWVGTLLSLIGGSWFYYIARINIWGIEILFIHWVIFLFLILNGFFLTFGVSRFLLKQEKETGGDGLLPAWWQKRIIVSFIFSFVGWWGSVALFVFALNSLINF